MEPMTVRGGITHAEWEALPDDGQRHEVIDGMLLVSPSPSLAHQRVLGALYRALHRNCPPELEVFMAPLDVDLTESENRLTITEPDLLVLRREHTGGTRLPAGVVPVLAVEVLSPSTPSVDQLVKREQLRRAGCPSYWLVDPDVLRSWPDAAPGGSFRDVGRALRKRPWCRREAWWHATCGAAIRAIMIRTATRPVRSGGGDQQSLGSYGHGGHEVARRPARAIRGVEQDDVATRTHPGPRIRLHRKMVTAEANPAPGRSLRGQSLTSSASRSRKQPCRSYSTPRRKWRLRTIAFQFCRMTS